MTWLVWVHRSAVAAAFSELQQHTVMIALLAGILAALVVSRQRSIHAAHAARSWLGALPVSPRARRVEAITLQLAPLIAALVLVSGLSLLAVAAFAVAGLPVGACFIAWRSLLLGTMLGAMGGLAAPLPKPVVLHPGSRYVPRVTRGRRPVPSLAALGIWPIRRMFSMLQPKALSRAALPLLVMMPLGTTAAAAMVWIGLMGALTALVFLAVSIVSVTQAARDWLKPLPLSSRRLGRVVAGRSLIAMVGIAAAAVWLTWVGGS